MAERVSSSLKLVSLIPDSLKAITTSLTHTTLVLPIEIETFIRFIAH
jgi:hypothetical protein